MSEPGGDLPGKEVAVHQPKEPAFGVPSTSLESTEGNSGERRLAQAIQARLQSPDALVLALPSDINTGKGRKTSFLVVDSPNGESHICIQSLHQPKSTFATGTINVSWLDEDSSRVGGIDIDNSWIQEGNIGTTTYIANILPGSQEKIVDFWKQRGGYDYLINNTTGRPMVDGELGELADLITNGHVNADLTEAARKFVIAQSPSHRRPFAPVVRFFQRAIGGRKTPPETKAITSK